VGEWCGLWTVFLGKRLLGHKPQIFVKPQIFDTSLVYLMMMMMMMMMIPTFTAMGAGTLRSFIWNSPERMCYYMYSGILTSGCFSVDCVAQWIERRS